jgi:hypothetical protein
VLISHQSYIESSSGSDNDNQGSKVGNFDDADYHPGVSTSGKSKPSRLKGDNQLVKPAIVKGKAPSNEEALVIALEKLKCTEDDLKQAFDSLRIPQCADRKKTPNGESHYTASWVSLISLFHAYSHCRSMPARILEEFGWDFNDQSQSRPTPDNMRSLYSTEPGKRVGMRQAPRFSMPMDNGKTSAVERAPREFQGRIIDNIDRIQTAMDSDDLAVPVDWGVSLTVILNTLIT